MKKRAEIFSKRLTQGLVVSFVFLAPYAFSEPELVLAAPQTTTAQAPKNLLKLPAPHRDLSVYDEGPVHYHYAKGTAVETLVISPAKPSIPTPSDTSSASQTIKVSAQTLPQPNSQLKAKSKVKAKKVNSITEDTDDDQVDSSSSSRFSLQKATGLGDQDSRVQINGFLSAGGLYVANSAYYQIPGYGNVNDNINFAAASRIGLQVTGNIAHNLAVVGQFVANGDNTVRQVPFNVNADWAYLRYIPRPEVQIRAGRFRLPTLFYSENAEVGYTYPWVVLPNEVYGIVPITNLNGLSTIASLSIGQSNWTLKTQPFFGSSTNQATVYGNYNPYIIPGTVVTFSQNNVYGTSMSIGNPYFEVRGSYMNFTTTADAPLAQAIAANAPLVQSFCPNGTRQVRCQLINQASSDFYSFGAKLDIDHFLLIGEYAHRNIAAIITAIDSYYLMAAYQFRGFMPNLTYAYAGTTNSRGLLAARGQYPQVQDSVTLGLNYTVNSNLLAKLSLSAIQPLNGTYGFFNTNPGRKTIMMYGVSLDAIF